MVLDAAKFAYATKTKKSVASKKSKSAISLLLNDPEECPASDKAQLFAKNFSSNSKLNDLCISLPIFLYRTNLKLHNISITPKMVTKVIILTHARHLVLIVFQLWFYRTVSLNFHIYYLNSSMCLKESCFPDRWKVSSVVSVFKNVGGRSTYKNYHPNKIAGYLEKCGLFLISSMVLGLFDKLLIFRKLSLIELLCLLTGLGPLKP